MTDPRIAKIVALLRTRGDLWPYPKGSSLRRRKAGFVGKLKLDCETCGATGKLKNGRDCAHCKGQGFTKVDPYDEPIKGSSPSRVEHGDPKCMNCDGRGVLPNLKRCIWCRGSGRITRPTPLDLDTERAAGPVDELDSIIEALMRRLERGDWPALDFALERLETHDPLSHRLIRLCYLTAPKDTVFGSVLRPKDLDDHDLMRLCLGLLFLAELMPETIRTPAYAMAYSRRVAAESDEQGKGRHANPYTQGERDRKIRELRESDPDRWSYTKLAEKFGITRRRIQQIVDDKHMLPTPKFEDDLRVTEGTGAELDEEAA